MPSAERQAAQAARRSLGQLGEALAAQHLEAAGLTLLARNVRVAGGGELDLIACSQQALVIVEVRCRRVADGAVGQALPRTVDPLLSITATKQRRLQSAAAAYLRQSAFVWPQVRFDVVGVTLRGTQPKLVWLQAAFDWRPAFVSRARHRPRSWASLATYFPPE